MGRKRNNSAKKTLEEQRARKRENQRKRRMNFTEEQIKHKREKDMERYYRLKEEKKIQTIEDKTPREKRKIRKYWRKCSKSYREKRKRTEDAISNTPPQSDEENSVSNQIVSAQKIRGRKQVRRDKAKVYRTVKKQSDEIKKLKQKVDKYKKRLQRQSEKYKKNLSPSPRKLVNSLLGRENVSPPVRRQLLLGFALQKQVETQVKKAGTKNKTQQIACKVIGSHELRKFRVQKYFNHIVPYSMNKQLKNQSFTYTRQKRRCIQLKEQKRLTAFFEEDTTSKMCPGKKDFVVQGKIKKQRRILLESMTNLYRRFLEQTKLKMSFATFCRSRPFWVVFPKKSDWDTCACIKHCNMDLMMDALKKNSIVTKEKNSEMLQKLVCSTKSKGCMTGQCDICRDREVEFACTDTDFKIKYFKWKTVKEERIIKGVKKTITKTVKSKEIANALEMKALFKKNLADFKEHVFYAFHQAQQVKKKVDGLNHGEILIRIDFSENYVAKHSQEVQSAHFGASKKQICLNTGVIYVRDKETVIPKPFATVSNNLDHQSHAVWAHLRPILLQSARLYPDTTAVHFVSDSPSNQYKNRMNIHLMKTLMAEIFPNLKYTSWNYTEPGHGKGPMDGVGGSLKREADRRVSYGEDIEDAASFVAVLKNSKVLLLEIKSQDVEDMKRKVSLMQVPPIKGIMKLRQVVYVAGNIYLKTSSCLECPAVVSCCKHFLVDSEEQKTHSTKRTLLKRPLEQLIEEVSSESEGEFFPKKTNPFKVWKLYSSDSDDSADETPLIERNLEISLPSGTSTSTGPTTTSEFTEGDIEIGSYLLVRLSNENKKMKQTFRQFVAINQTNVLTNGDLEVMFLKSTSADNTTFCIDEKDISMIDSNQVVAILPPPILVVKGDRLFYKFQCRISV